ncbi:MAG: dihydroorotase [Bradymonadia bacterium]
MGQFEAGTERRWVSGGRVICPASGIDAHATLIIQDGRIEAVSPEPATPGDHDQIIDATGSLVIPGLVDLHAHLGEPGFEHKEDLASAGRAAAHGGVTTLVAAPDTEPVNDARAITEFIIRRAAEITPVRVLPMATLTRGRRGDHLTDMFDLRDGGAVAFGEGDTALADASLLRRAMEYARAVGRPVFEWPEERGLARAAVMHEGPVATRLGLRGVPEAAERIAVDRAIALARLTGCPIHIGPISTAGAVEALGRAQSEGLPVTCAVTAMHLQLVDEAIAERYDSCLRVRPPLRGVADRSALNAGIASGVITAISSGHRPQSPVEKEVEFELAEPGIAGLETLLSQTLAQVEAGAFGLHHALAALTAAPAQIIGEQSGTLSPGRRADVVVVDAGARWSVSKDTLVGRSKNTPLIGQTLPGVVHSTIIDGEVVYSAVEHMPGQLLSDRG